MKALSRKSAHVYSVLSHHKVRTILHTVLAVCCLLIAIREGHKAIHILMSGEVGVEFAAGTAGMLDAFRSFVCDLCDAWREDV